AIFLTAILATITYLSVRKPDITPISGTLERQDSAQQFGPVQVETGPNRTAMIQTVCVILVFVIAGTGFYRYRTSELNRQAAASGSVGTKSPLGDLSAFSKITQDTLDLVVAGQQSRATTRVTDLETLWDQSEAVLKRRNPAEWTKLDATIDKVLRALRSTSPDSRTEEKDLRTLLGQLGD
ncbi:MAG TPA: hypothetical protein DHW34_04775, partial [Actinobacteria bacterium]|nr:hypothetical protein [Actinomycetota bacterium]